MITSGPCSDCGEVTEQQVTFHCALKGEPETYADHWLCVECYDRDYARALELRRQFQFLLDNGVSRERANEIMIKRIDNGK